MTASGASVRPLKNLLSSAARRDLRRNFAAEFEEVGPLLKTFGGIRGA